MKKTQGAGKNYKGSIGTKTRMVGEAISSPYGFIDYRTSNKARQLLKKKHLLANCTTENLDLKSLTEMVEQAAKHPTLIPKYSAKVIWAIWFRLAKSGELRGLWKPKE